MNNFKAITYNPGPDDQPWLLYCKFEYHEAFKDAIKAIPGVRGHANIKVLGWLVPKECRGIITRIGRKYGFDEAIIDEG